MTELLTLPMLPLDDVVVLPGMVVPLELGDGEIRAAVEAAQAGESGTDAQARVLLVPRLDGKYATVGTVGVIEQVGRLRGGEHAAVVRGTARARIGSAATGPGAALWVKAETQDETRSGDQVLELAREYKSLATMILQQRGAWQFVDSVQSITDPSVLADLAGYAPYLTNEQKLWLLETVDVTARLEKLVAWSREHLAELDVAETIRKDVHEGMEKQQREFLLRQQLAAIRKELGLSGKPRPRSRTTARGSRPPTCRRRCARPRWPRSTSWSAPRSSPPRSAGSAPGWTPCSSCRGTSAPMTPTTSPLPARCSTPTTPGWTTSRSGSSSTSRSAGGGPTAASVSSAVGAAAPCWPGRPARCRQDLARRVRRPRHGPQVRPGRARRRA